MMLRPQICGWGWITFDTFEIKTFEKSLKNNNTFGKQISFFELFWPQKSLWYFYFCYQFYVVEGTRVNNRARRSSWTAFLVSVTWYSYKITFCDKFLTRSILTNFLRRPETFLDISRRHFQGVQLFMKCASAWEFHKFLRGPHFQNTRNSRK